MPKRKHPRLKKYDYSSAGAYFVTICTQNRKCLLSRIENSNVVVVGRGLAPAVTKGIEYTNYGKIAEKQLLLLEERYSFLKSSTFPLFVLIARRRMVLYSYSLKVKVEQLF